MAGTGIIAPPYRIAMINETPSMEAATSRGVKSEYSELEAVSLHLTTSTRQPVEPNRSMLH